MKAYKGILCKVLKKFRLNHLFYRMLSAIYSSERVELPSYEESERLLSIVCPDNGKSCVTAKNSITTPWQYDLQIIIPAYNVEPYIKKCLDSVFCQQTNYRFLVVVVNDGSTDATAEILINYHQTDNLTIIHQENQGLSGARNRALEKISAEYVTFLDSDDELAPNAIQLLMDAAKANDSDLVAGGYECFNDSRTFQVVHLKKQAVVPEYLSIPGFAWGKIYRSHLFQDVHFPEKYWFEDTIVSMVLLQKCRTISTISEPVYRYRSNPGGISATSVSNPKSLDSFYITRRLLDDRRKMQIEDNESVFAIILLRQIYINFKRIITIGRDDLDRAVFALSVKMVEDEFDNRPTDMGRYEDLYETLVNRNFSRYKLFCLLQ